MAYRTFGVMRGRWETTRTEAFSDGVFSIASTLLVLEVAVPESDLHDLWSGIGHQWPSYLAYATSFVTIGGIWLAHHSIFRRLRYANTGVIADQPRPAEWRSRFCHSRPDWSPKRFARAREASALRSSSMASGYL